MGRVGNFASAAKAEAVQKIAVVDSNVHILKLTVASGEKAVWRAPSP
jgi:hypothetical protein